MPLLLKKEEPEFKLGIWKIDEQMSFFAGQIPFQSVAAHESRQLQQLATRYVLYILQHDFPFTAIEINASGKPYLQDCRLQFNLSHTSLLAAAIVSDRISVGIDVEKISPRVLKIQHKFINEDEAVGLVGKTIDEQISILTKYWTIKEAVYKWWGKGSVDFAGDICIQTTVQEEKLVSVYFNKEGGMILEVNCFQLADHWVTYVVQ